MKTLLAALSFALLTGCSTVIGWIPSFNDANQSARITDVRLAVDALDCAQAQHPQAVAISRELRWFELYSQSKGLRQQDVQRIIEPIQGTAKEWRARGDGGSRVYCEIKKRILTEQAARAATAILGRF